MGATALPAILSPDRSRRRRQRSALHHCRQSAASPSSEAIVEIYGTVLQHNQPGDLSNVGGRSARRPACQDIEVVAIIYQTKAVIADVTVRC